MNRLRGLPQSLFGLADAHRLERGYERTASRRQFLKTAIGGAAIGSGAWAIPLSAGRSREASEVVVGGHVWVYAATQPGYDPTPVLEQAFADMNYAGLGGIELMHQALLHDDAVERIGGLSRKYALPVIGTSFGGSTWNRAAHASILADAEKLLARLARLGGRTLGTSVGAAPALKTPEQLDAQADLLRKLLVLCKEHGIVLNLHNHTNEVEHHEYDLKETLARLPEIKLGPDLNWLVRAGVDPVDFIKRYGDRIVFLHLRDQKADGTWSEALGEGAMDYVAIGRALAEINFSGEAVVELAHEKDFKRTRPLRETWRMSREFVRRVLGF